MKKILAFVAAALLLAAIPAESSARGGIVVKGGLTFSDMINDVSQTQDYTGFHAGIGAQVPLAFGFAVQPELVYDLKGSKLNDVNWKTGYIDAIVNLQWGVDLIAFKPFIFAAPFVGYNVQNVVDIVNNATTETSIQALNNMAKKFSENINKVEYGLGLGAGIDVWKFQITGKYVWNFGEISKIQSVSDVTGKVKDINLSNAGGFELSLGFVF